MTKNVQELIEMQKIFSDEVINFISNEMKICVVDLMKKILSDVPYNHQFFNLLFEQIMNIQVPYEYENTLSSFNNDENRTFINDSLYDFLESNGLSEDSEEYFIFDNIRHAFINFKQGGILLMYQYREAEAWYPKVIIDSFLGDQEDIDHLGDNITIYRGTSIDEYKSGIFGQSWTLSERIAQDFAFIHYSSHPNYKNQERVVIKSIISKDIIFFYSQSGREEEVIIDSSKLSSPVTIIKRLILE